MPVVIGRFRPQPGVRAEDLEIPGPGLYEADFDVPDWALPDFNVTRRFEVQLAGQSIEHLHSAIDGGILTVRFRVHDGDRAVNFTPETASILGPLTIGLVIRGMAGILFGALAIGIIQAVVDALREVRKLGETPAGLGLAALGLAGAYLLVKGGK